MTTCQRFEEEGLLRLEQGLPLNAHFSSCPDCQAARAMYERLQQEIASLERFEPPVGWEKRVWESIGDAKTARGPVNWMSLAGWGVAAAVVAVILLPPLFQQPAAPSLQTEVQAGTGPTRRGEAVPGSPVVLGSLLQLSATARGAPFVELRVYRNADQLIFQTSRVGEPAENEMLHATLLLDAVGDYQSALFVSNESIPPPSGSPDADYAAARNAGAEIILGSPISVR